MKLDAESAGQKVGRVSQRLVLLALLAMLGTQPGALWAGTNEWTSIGPDGGNIQALAIDPQNPSTVYAGTWSGVFKSTDGGANWYAFNSGIAVSTLAIDPGTPSIVYGAGYGGVFKSMDGGATWSAASSGLPPSTATTLAIDPRNPTTVYADVNGGLFKSTDGGTSWSAASSGLTSSSNWIGALVIDPKNPSTIYAGTSGAFLDGCSVPCSGFGDGVFVSTDGGTSWTAVNSGLTTTHVSCLAIDPQNPSRLYAGTIGGGVFAITFVP